MKCGSVVIPGPSGQPAPRFTQLLKRIDNSNVGR